MCFWDGTDVVTDPMGMVGRRLVNCGVVVSGDDGNHQAVDAILPGCRHPS